jgi:outer membrane protein assembly factor BamD (BamD/ComL family)
MSHTWQIISEIVGGIAFVAIIGWAAYRTLCNSAERGLLIFKWVLTGIVFIPLIMLVRYLRAKVDQGVDYGVAFFVPIGAFVLAMILTVIWRKNLGSIFANAIGGLYDGGSEEIEVRPLYSIAQSKRNRGNYTEAIADIRKQLEKFPGDLEGQVMLAQIQAENLNDLPAAEITIQRLCDEQEHPPGSIASALNLLADWHLKFSQDPDAARKALEKIIELLPDSEFSVLASQRIAHLADREFLTNMRDRKRIRVGPAVANIGLLPSELHPKAPQVDPAAQAAEYVRHLAEHPLDTDAREQLALIYAHHYGRLDMAAGELEQLIASPGQPAKRVTHWLNLLADLQVQHSADYEVVRQTVQRIIDLFPQSAAAQTARNRLDHLKLELKAKGKSQTVRLGSYEKDIGLKGGWPNRF